MKKLYVGNLSYSTTDSGLSAAFDKFGSLASAKVITDKFSGQSRGFGFVEIEDDEEATRAISEMDGISVDGKVIKVNEARPQERSGGGSGRSGGWGGGGNSRSSYGNSRGGGRQRSNYSGGY